MLPAPSNPRSKKQILLAVIAFTGVATIGALVGTLAAGGSADSGASNGATAAQNNADKVIPDGTGSESPQGQLGEPSPQERINWYLPYNDVPLLVKYEGDLVEFVFESDQAHDLAVVNTAEEYANCDVSNAIQICPRGTIETVGRCAFSVPQRTLLMVCTVPNHCANGQKMIIQGIERPVVTNETNATDTDSDTDTDDEGNDDDSTGEEPTTPINATNATYTNSTHEDTETTVDPSASPTASPTQTPTVTVVEDEGDDDGSDGETGTPTVEGTPTLAPTLAPTVESSTPSASPTMETVAITPSTSTPTPPTKSNGGWTAK